MRTSKAWRTFAAGVMAALVLVAGPVAPPSSAEADQPHVLTPIYGTSPLVIPGAAFSSDGLDPASMWFSFYGGYMQGGNWNTCVKAPANLPNYAGLRQMCVSLYDNAPSASVWARLYRVDNYSGAVDQMAYAETTSEYDGIQSWCVTVDDPTVSYPEYSYYVGACLESSATRLYSVRLWYTLAHVYLPTLLRNSH